MSYPGILGSLAQQPTGGILGNGQMQPWQSSLGLLASALKDAGAQLGGRPEDANSVLQYQQLMRQNQLRQAYATAATTNDPQAAQQASALILANGGDPTAIQRYRASQAMPQLLDLMKPQTQYSLDPKVAQQIQAGQTTSAAPTISTTPGLSLADALPKLGNTLNSQYLSQELGPQLINRAMNQAQRVDPTQYGFPAGSNAYRLPDGRIVSDTQSQAAVTQVNAQKKITPITDPNDPRLPPPNARPPGAQYGTDASGNIVMINLGDARSPLAQTQAVDQKEAALEAQMRLLGVGSPGAPGGPAIGTTGDPLMHPEKPGYTTSLVPGTGGLTQAALDQSALSYDLTGKLPSLGFGSNPVTQMQRRAIMARGAEMNPGGNIQANAAQYKSLSNSLTNLTKVKNDIETAVNNSAATGNQLISAFQGKVNTSIPLANIFSNAAAYHLTPAEISSYRAGLQEVANTYSQVFARNGRLTDAVRSRAQAIADGNISVDALSKVFDELNTQAGLVVKGYGDQIGNVQEQLRSILTGKPAASAPPKAQAKAPPNPTQLPKIPGTGGRVIKYDAKGNRLP